MGRNKEWETKRHSGSEGESIEMRDRDERVRDKFFFFFFLEYCYSTILSLELYCNTIAKKFAIVGYDIP